jgi:hypothetical protein
MVINDLNTLRMALSPEKANSPLVVDASAVLSLSIPLERFKPIRSRQSKIFQSDSCINRVELHKCPPLNLARESFHKLTLKDSLGIGITE